MPVNAGQFEVFYDGECPLCRREIDMIRRKDKRGRLLLTDISEAGFVLQEYDQSALMKEIHGRKPDGTFVTGVEVFRQIYQRIGFQKFVAPTRLPVIRHLLNLAYWLFSKMRYAHAMHRARKKSRISCDTNSCEVDTSDLSSGLSEKSSDNKKRIHNG